MDETPAPRLRVDKWLWQARFFKSRALAADCAGTGGLRINGQRCEKPAQAVRPGDVLTFPQAGRIRVVRIEAIGERRGPAAEAQALYTDLEPPEEERSPRDAPAEAAPAPEARPDKRDRRALGRMRRIGT